MKKDKCLEEEIQRMENTIHKLEEDKQVLRSRKENLFDLKKAKMELLSKDAIILTNTVCGSWYACMYVCVGTCTETCEHVYVCVCVCHGQCTCLQL